MITIDMIVIATIIPIIIMFIFSVYYRGRMGHDLVLCMYRYAEW